MEGSLAPVSCIVFAMELPLLAGLLALLLGFSALANAVAGVFFLGVALFGRDGDAFGRFGFHLVGFLMSSGLVWWIVNTWG